MKNHLTLIIASFLLVLCVLEKQASDKASKNVNVENMYNFPDKNLNRSPISDQNTIEQTKEGNSLYDPSPLFQFASIDSSSQNSPAKVMNQNLLNISAGNKILNY